MCTNRRLDNIKTINEQNEQNAKDKNGQTIKYVQQ